MHKNSTALALSLPGLFPFLHQDLPALPSCLLLLGGVCCQQHQGLERLFTELRAFQNCQRTSVHRSFPCTAETGGRYPAAAPHTHIGLLIPVAFLPHLHWAPCSLKSQLLIDQCQPSSCPSYLPPSTLLPVLTQLRLTCTPLLLLVPRSSFLPWFK